MFGDDDDCGDAHPKGSVALHRANEMTFLAWARTIIALLAFGCAIGELAIFLDQSGADERAPYLGSVVVLATAVLALGFAVSSYRGRSRAIERGDRLHRRTRLLYLYAAVIAATAIVLVWQLFDDIHRSPPSSGPPPSLTPSR